MKMLVFFISLFIWSVAPAQQLVELSAVDNRYGADLYASNLAFCPVTIAVQLTIQNLRFSKGDQASFVIPARTNRVKLGSLGAIDMNKTWNYTWKFRWYYGDMFLRGYDSLYEYALPYEKEKSFTVVQGYNGAFSHQGQQAVDFLMPEGTRVLAAREGVVIRVVQEYNQACLEPACRDKANLIIIYQPDGTMAGYAHLKYNGAVVKEGDKVNKGDLIAYSGNTGYSTSPHLHFDCFLPDTNPVIKRTIATRFIVSNTAPAVYLKEGVAYSKDY